MREILFRGQTRRIGEKLRMDGTPIDSNWVYGGVFQGDGDLSIIYSYDSVKKYIVYAETVGQYTGLTDKNGVKIFEGDVVSFKRDNALGYTTCRVGDVRYYDKLSIFYVMATTGDAWDFAECYEITVIGNIHDNPELLKDGDEEECP